MAIPLDPNTVVDQETEEVFDYLDIQQYRLPLGQEQTFPLPADVAPHFPLVNSSIFKGEADSVPMAGTELNENNEIDRMLVQQVLDGNQDAMEQLVLRYQASVKRLCWRTLQNSHEAEDATQEALLRAFQHLKTYKPQGKFSSWLYSIAAHHCIDLLRKRHPCQDLTQILSWKASQDPELDEIIVSEEEHEEVRQLLNELPEKYRGVLILRYWHNYTYGDIAKATGLPLSSVKVRLFRAREIMAKALNSTPALKSGATRYALTGS